MERSQDRVAIVTGAGQGVGAGVARALAKDGVAVVVANRSADTGEAVATAIERDFPGARARFIATDVGDAAGVRSLVNRTVDAFGRVDILVNNATPAGGGARLEDMSHDAVEQHIRVNYYAAFWAMQAVFPLMKEQRWGRIISMASLNGINAHRHTTMYNASKEALRALTRTAAVEWARHGITANIVCPFAATPAWDLFARHVPEGAKSILAVNPMGRPGDSEHDIGPLVAFLASDESRYITGNTIHADGGGHINGVPWALELPE